MTAHKKALQKLVTARDDSAAASQLLSVAEAEALAAVLHLMVRSTHTHTLSIYLSISLSLCLSLSLSIYLSIYLSVYLSLSLSRNLSRYLSTIYLAI